MTTREPHVPVIAARTLACAVIKQAIADSVDPTVPHEVQRDAREFLAGHLDYQRWCEVAGIAPESIRLK